MAEPRQALAGTLTLLAATFGLLLAAAVGNDGAPEGAVAGRGAEPIDPARLLELSRARTPAVARRVEGIRELRFARVPRPGLADAEDLERLTERLLSRPRIRAQVRVADIELRLLGLLDPAESIADVAGDTQALAAAYYEPRRERLFVVGGAVPAGRELAEFVLAHELTHALEDQRFGLPEQFGVTDDRVLARTALVEGTATALMLDYATRHLDVLQLAADAQAIDSGSGGLPRFALDEIEFTYFGGAEFVSALRAVGAGWKLVDYAYEARPPASTEQVLHPGKYLADERPLPTAPPRSPGPRWRRLDAGDIGEFATIQVLRVGLDEDAARAAAAGWGGDVYRLWQRRCRGSAPCPGRHALGVAWRWDSRAEAREFEAALERYLTAGLEARRAGGAWEAGRSFAATAAGADTVVLGLGPSRAVASRLARITHLGG